MQRIPLTRGQFAIVDDADYEELSKCKWYANKNRSGHYYAVRQSPKENGKQFEISMSRQILGLERGDPRQADHQNHNTLDNCRVNIRICSRQENQMNQKSHSNTTSKFKGVSWCKLSKKWRAHITINRKQKSLGSFVKEELAALAYDFAALKYHREFANFNF